MYIFKLNNNHIITTCIYIYVCVCLCNWLQTISPFSLSLSLTPIIHEFPSWKNLQLVLGFPSLGSSYYNPSISFIFHEFSMNFPACFWCIYPMILNTICFPWSIFQSFPLWFANVFLFFPWFSSDFPMIFPPNFPVSLLVGMTVPSPACTAPQSWLLHQQVAHLDARLGQKWLFCGAGWGPPDMFVGL